MDKQNTGSYVKSVYNLLFKNNVPAVNIDYSKIFEYAKDTKVTGTSSPSETIKISKRIIMGQNRTFVSIGRNFGIY